MAINEIQKAENVPVDSGLAAMSLVLAVVGLGLVADAIRQSHINRIYGVL